MKNERTGLLIDSMETSVSGVADGTRSEILKAGPCTVTTVRLDSDEKAKAFGREKGTYITIETDRVYRVTDNDFEAVVDVLSGQITSLMPVDMSRVLVAGLGNREITADSLGPKSIDRIVVTRGYERTMPQLFDSGDYASVCAISANVFGVTGIESAELIGGIVATVKPSLVIVIDALATASVNRLCKTIQLSDTSLTPGGGVDNARKKISPDDFRVPIISIGMPTVIDASALLKNAGCSEKNIFNALGDDEDAMIAMPARIDSATDAAAKMIAFAVNKSLHQKMSTEDILRFLY